MRTLLHRLVDIVCDAALKLYDLTLDGIDAVRRIVAARTQSTVPGWDELTQPDPAP